MSKSDLILDLAKLVISAAWADGELANEEVNALKELLFSLDEVSAEDWTTLKMYMESPTSAEETEELLKQVTNAIRSSEDKVFALNVLEQLFKCDGKVTDEEQKLMDKLKGDISDVDTGLLSGISRALKSAIQERKAAVQATCLREQDSEDYIKNTIYYDLMRKQEELSVTIDRPESEVRKLCLATGLLSHLANVDEVIEEEEQAAMRKIIAEDWVLSDEQAGLLVSICCDRATRGFDYFRLSHGFYECTSIEERRKFLKTLFLIANAANKTDNEEIEEIRRISKSLKLSHTDFIDAKLTISREDRKGL